MPKEISCVYYCLAGYAVRIDVVAREPIKIGFFDEAPATQMLMV